MVAFAQKLFRTPANSVPSERAFSIQNLLHTKTRNCMLPERANKLEFLYINSCVFRQKQEKNRQEKREDWLTLGEDGEVEMEDYFSLLLKLQGWAKDREKIVMMR